MGNFDQGAAAKTGNCNSNNIIPQRSENVKPLDAALGYAARGWRVYPVHSIEDGHCTCHDPGGPKCKPGKHPRTQHGLNDATTDPAKITQWWRQYPASNIGIATGVASGLVVLDVDGPEGEKSLKELETRYGPLPETIQARSGGGGRHFYFQHPGNGIYIKSVSLSDILGLPKLDIKADGGCIISPPSNHVSGGFYTWLSNGTPLAACPKWLIEAQAQKRPSKKQHDYSTGPTVAGGRIPDGQRHSTLLSLAGSMRRRDMIDEEIEAALLKTNERCDPPLPTDAVKALARDVAARYEPADSSHDQERIDDAIKLHTVEAAFLIVDALARLSPAEYGIVKARLKDGCEKLNLNDLDRAVNAERKKRKQQVHSPNPSKPTRPRAAPATLEDVVGSYRKYLYLPDDGVIKVTLATAVANRMKGDPVWLLLIASSSVGKTELVVPLGNLDNSIAVSTLTVPSLLSGTSAKERAQNANGGVLRVLGERGLLVLKDFGSLLSMGKEACAELLAALREIYDGHWNRGVGTDGGQTLEWAGKIGIIGCATKTIDQHHVAMAKLGERFIYYRLSNDHEEQRTAFALENVGKEADFRKDVAEKVRGFLDNLQIPERGIVLSDEERKKLNALARFTARTRSPVERDSRSRSIVSLPDTESPTRLVKVFALLLRALRIIGVLPTEAWHLIQQVAWSSMPAIRSECIGAILTLEDPISTANVAIKVSLPQTTIKRVLEDLAAHDVLRREQMTGNGNPDLWRLSDWASETHTVAFLNI